MNPTIIYIGIAIFVIIIVIVVVVVLKKEDSDVTEEDKAPKNVDPPPESIWGDKPSTNTSMFKMYKSDCTDGKFRVFRRDYDITSGWSDKITYTNCVACKSTDTEIATGSGSSSIDLLQCEGFVGDYYISNFSSSASAINIEDDIIKFVLEGVLATYIVDNDQIAISGTFEYSTKLNEYDPAKLRESLIKFTKNIISNDKDIPTNTEILFNFSEEDFEINMKRTNNCMIFWTLPHNFIINIFNNKYKYYLYNGPYVWCMFTTPSACNVFKDVKLYRVGITYMREKIPLKDENGNEMKDENGNTLYENQERGFATPFIFTDNTYANLATLIIMFIKLVSKVNFKNDHELEFTFLPSLGALYFPASNVGMGIKNILDINEIPIIKLGFVQKLIQGNHPYILDIDLNNQGNNGDLYITIPTGTNIKPLTSEEQYYDKGIFTLIKRTTGDKVNPKVMTNFNLSATDYNNASYYNLPYLFTV